MSLHLTLLCWHGVVIVWQWTIDGEITVYLPTDLDLSRMLACLGGSLASCCGGEVAGDSEAEPQLLEPECEEDIELVRCLGTCTAPAASLRFTICTE